MQMTMLAVMCGGMTVMALATYAVVFGGIPLLVWPWLKRVSTNFRYAFMVSCFMAGALVMGSGTASAMAVPERCYQYNYWQWPCWVIEMLWCQCTWIWD